MNTGLKLNEIESKNYTKHHRYYSDNVTEYSYTTDKSLGREEFERVLEEGKAYLCGMIQYTKRQLSFNSGKVLFQHICKVSMSVN